jgi:predicted aspartyl protease
VTIHKVAGFLFVLIDLLLIATMTASLTLANDSVRQNVTLPFTLRQGYLVVVEGSLGSLARRRLIVDTGTSSTVLDCSVARQLGLGGRESRLTMLNGDEQVKAGVLSSLTLGPVVAKSLPVFITNLSFLTRQLGMRIDGIVGLDVLKSSSFRIEYDTRQIVFGPVQSSPGSVPFATGPPLVTINMEIEGQPARVLVDTGASGLLLFRREDRGRGHGRALEAHTSSNITGNFTREEIRISDTKVGSVHLHAHSVFLVRAAKDASRDFDGLMGIGAMGVKEVAFDFEHQRIDIKR